MGLKCPHGHGGLRLLDDSNPRQRVYQCPSCKREGKDWVYKVTVPDAKTLARRVLDGDEKTITGLVKAPRGFLTLLFLDEEHTGFSDAAMAEGFDLCGAADEKVNARRVRA